jgi:hypothetical protein
VVGRGGVLAAACELLPRGLLLRLRAQGLAVRQLQLPLLVRRPVNGGRARLGGEAMRALAAALLVQPRR